MRIFYDELFEMVLIRQLGRDSKHAEWVKLYLGLLEQCRTYAVEYHATGLTWNPKVSSNY